MKWRNLSHQAILFFCCLLSVATNSYAEPILIGTTQSPSAKSLQIENRLSSAYASLGLQVHFIPLPSERRLRQVSNNQLAGDVFRICQLGEEDERLVTVQAPLAEFFLQAFSLSAETLADWQQKADLVVVHVRGLKMAELTAFTGTRLEVTDLRQAVGMLLQGRADIMLEDELSAAAYLAEQESTLPKLHITTLAPFAVCHVLSREQAHLAEPLRQRLLAPQP